MATFCFRALLLALPVATLLSPQDTATLSGEIRDPAGAAIPFGELELRLERPPFTLFSLRLDNLGRFRFTLLPAGSYTLTVALVGFKALKVKSIPVASGEQKIVPPVRMELAPTDMPWMPIPIFNIHAGHQGFGNLAGRVMQNQTRALAGATVTLFCDDERCGETKTDANGNFIFLNLAPRDDYAFRISHPGFYSWQGSPSGYTAFEVVPGYDATYDAIMLPRPRHGKLSRGASTVREPVR